MKKIMVFGIALALMAGGVFGWDVGGMDYLTIGTIQSYTNGTFYSTASNTNAFNATAYNGFGKLIVFVSGDEGTVANTNVDKVFIQSAPYSTGTWATVTDSSVTNYMPTLTTTATVSKVNVDLETLKNFVRIGVTTSSTGETNASHTVAAVLVCPAKND